MVISPKWCFFYAMKGVMPLGVMGGLVKARLLSEAIITLAGIVIMFIFWLIDRSKRKGVK